MKNLVSGDETKWFAVRKPSTGEIIATSANQIVLPKYLGGTKMLYYIHQTPLSFWSVEGGGSRDKTSDTVEVWYMWCHCVYHTPAAPRSFLVGWMAPAWRLSLSR